MMRSRLLSADGIGVYCSDLWDRAASSIARLCSIPIWPRHGVSAADKELLGEPESAIERFARAMRLSPLDSSAIVVRGGTAHAHFFWAAMTKQRRGAAMTLQDNPDFQGGLRIDGREHAMAGRAGASA